MQTILLLGATGSTGHHILREALESGFAVRAYLRSPHKIPEDLQQHPHLERVEGDFDAHDRVRAAIQGVDAVVVAGGDAKVSRDRKLMHPLVQAIATAMREHGVKRLIYQADSFALAPGETAPLWVRWFFQPVLSLAFGIGGMVEDNTAVLAFLHEQDDLDWTVTRPSTLAEGPSKGTVVAADGMGAALQFVDLARFTLGLVSEPRQVREAPFLKYE